MVLAKIARLFYTILFPSDFFENLGFQFLTLLLLKDL